MSEFYDIKQQEMTKILSNQGRKLTDSSNVTGLPAGEAPFMLMHSLSCPSRIRTFSFPILAGVLQPNSQYFIQGQELQ